MANNFQLTLDTLAPTGSISRGNNQFHNANFALTITKGDATFMYVWFDTSATTSTIPSGTSAIAASTSYTTTFSENGNFYYHLVLMDDVGNQSEVYHTAVICYDTVAPTVNSVELCNRDGSAAEVVTTREIAIKFGATDPVTSSGLVSCAISGDINAESTAWVSTLTAQEIATLEGGNTILRSIVLSGTGEEEAVKTVSITVTDAAGNVSTAVADTITLDTLFLQGHIVLKNADQTKTITEQWVNVADFNIVLDAADKDDWKGYKVWGDFNTDGGASGTSEPSTFTDLTQAEITAKKVVLARKWTSGDHASKKVRASLIDNNGNITVIGTDHGTAPTVDRYEYASVDYTAPSVSVTVKTRTDGKPSTHVSNITGYTQLTLVPTVDAAISGAASYQWYLDGSAYPSGSGTGTPGEFVVDSANMGTEGAKSFTLKVVDNAGNEATSTAAIIYLDTTAPTGSITMNAWYGGDSVVESDGFHKYSTAGATASATDGPSGDGASGMKYMTCWCSLVATDTTVPGTAVQKDYSANPAHADIDWTSHGESATNYIHIKYVDAVGNAGFAHSTAFGIDTTCDAAGSVAFTKEAYPSTSASVVLESPSSVSPIASFKVWGDISTAATEAAASWETYSNSKAVTLTTGDGIKNINIRYRDTAGNISVDPTATDSTELDTSTPSATVTLHVSGSTDAKSATSNVKESDMHVSCSESTEGKEFYQVYGDFTTNGTLSAQGLSYKACVLYAEATAYTQGDLVLYEGNVYAATANITAAENTGWSAISAKMTVNTDYWKEYNPGAGVSYVNIATICTSGDGNKVFYAVVMDNAGNISNAASASFTYDTTAPVPTISDVDHNRISKVHTLRKEVSGSTVTELTTYNDETKFRTTPDTDCQAYKIVAYVSLVAAEAGSHNDAAVGTTAGSTNMSASGIEFGPNQTLKYISHMIKGADYEAALITKYNTSGMSQAEAEAAGFVFEAGEVQAIDGAHYVVVYVQDFGGTWSVAASFTA